MGKILDILEGIVGFKMDKANRPTRKVDFLSANLGDETRLVALEIVLTGFRNFWKDPFNKGEGVYYD